MKEEEDTSVVPLIGTTDDVCRVAVTCDDLYRKEILSYPVVSSRDSVYLAWLGYRYHHRVSRRRLYEKASCLYWYLGLLA